MIKSKYLIMIALLLDETSNKNRKTELAQKRVIPNNCIRAIKSICSIVLLF